MPKIDLTENDHSMAKPPEKKPQNLQKPSMPIGENLPSGPPPDFANEQIPYTKLFYWGWKVVSVALWWFIINTGLSICVEVLTQFNVQVLATVVSGLTAPTEAGMAASGKGSAGFLSNFLPQNVETAAILFAVLALGIIILRLLDRFLSAWTDNTMLGRLQQKLHDKLITLGPSFHHKHQQGETMVTINQFATGTQMILRDLISFPIVRGISLITAFYFLLTNMNALGDTPLWIRIFLFSALFILPIGGWWLAKRIRTAAKQVVTSQAAMANELSNSISFPLEVQLMGANKQRSEAFAQKIITHIKNKITVALRSEAANQFQVVTPLILQAVFLIYGVFFALKSGNPAAAGSILAIFYFVPEAVNPIQSIIQFVTGLNSAWPQVEKVVQILEEKPEIEEHPDAIDLSPEDSIVTFDNVTFRYKETKHNILTDFSHQFEAGLKTAVVARAGGGKSTVLNLIARLYEAQNGTITIGDKNIQNIKFSSLRKQIVKVSQFPLFIEDTIRNNFLLAKADATDDELDKISQMTGLWEVLNKKEVPEGQTYLDYVLPKSDGLSGGQRRLFAITRALLLKPAVLLLDEPTTGIDDIGRKLLIEVLNDACKDITVIIVDHDMRFISMIADQVCCLEDGRFVDIGTPEELSKRTSLFKQLLNSFGKKEESNSKDWEKVKPMADGLSKGIKINPEEAKILDRGKMEVAIAVMPEESDVEGQALSIRTTDCPWCGNFLQVTGDTSHETWYTCGRCGGPFRF